MPNCNEIMYFLDHLPNKIVNNFIHFYRTLGEHMGKPHILGSSADSPWVKFPDDFCLGPLVNDSCETSAGISAVVYDSNPMVTIILE